jgi:hypothetical protein
MHPICAINVTVPAATTQRTFDATDEGRDLVVCKDAAEMFKKLGIVGAHIYRKERKEKISMKAVSSHRHSKGSGRPEPVARIRAGMSNIQQGMSNIQVKERHTFNRNMGISFSLGHSLLDIGYYCRGPSTTVDNHRWHSTDIENNTTATAWFPNSLQPNSLQPKSPVRDYLGNHS